MNKKVTQKVRNKMTTTEWCLSKLPKKLTRTSEKHCFHCGASYSKTYEYELQIKVGRFFAGRKNGKDEYEDLYKVFYNCRSLPNGDNDKYIGIAVGKGECTMKKAIKWLIPQIKRYRKAMQNEKI